MENKANAATPQRPLGGRALNAELLLLDLPAAARQLRQEPAWTGSDRNALTLFKNDALRLVLTALHAGATMKTHTANGAISVQVLDGRLRFGTAAQTVELGPGQLLTLQAGVPHSVTALEETTFLLTLAMNGY